MSEAQFGEAATNSDPQVQRAQVCELTCCTAELARLAANADVADKRFSRALEICPTGFIEREAAAVRLMPAGALSAVTPGKPLAVEE